MKDAPVPMPMYQTVLIPTDGSEVAFKAAEQAVEMTDADGTVHVLSIVENLPLYRQSGQGAKRESKDLEPARAHAEEAIHRIEELVTADGKQCETELEEGVPYRKILNYAQEIDADAVVMGKRGLGAATEDILGSTTERVARGTSSILVIVPE